jgi:hypothetical protein
MRWRPSKPCHGSGTGIAEDAARERAVVFARVGDHLDGNAGLAQGAIHLLRLA